jgi:transmembrane 9 superfamily protein 2/4
MFRPKPLLSGTLGLLLPLCANAFYLPGASPHNYALGEKVNLFVNALTPMLSGHEDSKLVSDYTTWEWLLIRVCCPEICHKL